MSQKIEALIFDLDGTLADSLGDIGGAMNDVLIELGRQPHPLSAYKTFVGEGVEHLVRQATHSEEVQPVPLGDIVARYRQFYRQRNHASSLPYAGIAEMLDAMVLRKIPMAVLSNKLDEPTRHLVSHHFARWNFAAVRGERPGVPRKPDPTAAIEIAQALSVPAASIGFVGDTAYDMKAAVAAGMQPIGVLWGFRDRHELMSAGAKYLLSHPSELVAIVENP